MAYTPTVVFDFDGVIHSYASGWKGEDVIPDPPVPGIKEAIDELREGGYRVVVVSTRCSGNAGMGAVTKYLKENGIVVDDVLAEKPPAICYIDDRAICFRGDASAIPGQVRSFKTWLSGGKGNEEPVKGLRPCKATTYVKRAPIEVTGRFHRWATNYQEFEEGPGNYTEALVELDDGRIVSCIADSVRFLDRS